tara:strand:- start:442 stop:651 length:210 start_codon:yes stop_codon:yes gene_type:complete
VFRRIKRNIQEKINTRIMNENWQVVCYSKNSDWEQVVHTGLSEENAYEFLAELNAVEANGEQGFYVNKA